MKIIILLLSLLGLTFSLPINPQINQLGNFVATSNSKEILRLLQRFKTTGNTPQQTQQRSKPGLGMPPAKLVPDQNTLTNQLNEVTPFEWPFVNFPWIFPQIPSELGALNPQSIPAFNLQMVPMDINYLTALYGGSASAQTLPVGGRLTGPQQLLPPQAILPIILAPMGPQGAVLSSEEMPLSQLYAGVLFPGTQGALLPSGQAEALPEGQEGPLPAGQAGSNPGNSAGLPFPEDTAGGTAVGIQKVSPTTYDGPNDAAVGFYPTPSGFRKLGADNGVTSNVFAEPTDSMNMEPSELREPPTSTTRLNTDNTQSHRNVVRSLVRGDSHAPTSTVASKLWKEP